MINFEKIQEDNFKIKIVEDRWKITDDDSDNSNLMNILEEKYGIEFIQYENDIFVPMNLTYIGGDGFSSVYSINNNDSIVIKVTNEKSEIKFANELISNQLTKPIYLQYFVRTQMLIPSNISTENNTEDYYKSNNVYIILEKLNPLSKNEIKFLDELDNYYNEITGNSIFSDYREVDLPRFTELLMDYVESNFVEDDYTNRDFCWKFNELYNEIIDFLIWNNWYDFNPKNIMKDNNNNLKIIDLQSDK